MLVQGLDRNGNRRLQQVRFLLIEKWLSLWSHLTFEALIHLCTKTHAQTFSVGQTFRIFSYKVRQLPKSRRMIVQTLKHDNWQYCPHFKLAIINGYLCELHFVVRGNELLSRWNGNLSTTKMIWISKHNHKIAMHSKSNTWIQDFFFFLLFLVVKFKRESWFEIQMPLQIDRKLNSTCDKANCNQVI